VHDDTDARRWDADEAVSALYSAHYRSLVRLATMLLHDTGSAEEVVQDAFVAMHGRWSRLRDPDRAAGYLRQAVVNRARSALRHRGVAARHEVSPGPDQPGADVHALAAELRRDVVQALRRLPVRQREAVVLRYYADLSEAETAEVMGVSRGSVKTHASRGVAALRPHLERLA
jgi:RNA polymerase sigma-70 factor (sigma-E family)